MNLRRRYSPVPLLPCCVPYLCLYCFPINLDASCCKLYSNGTLAFQIKLISSKSRQEVTLSNTRISNKDNFKEVVVLVVAGAHGAAEELRGGSGGGNGGGTRGRRCRGNPSERGASAAGPGDEPRPVCVTSGRPQPLAESTSGEMAPRP